MTPRVIAAALCIMVGSSIALAQTPAPSTPPASADTKVTPAKPSSAEKREATAQRRAAKKAERIAVRKKRVECYDQAKKQSLTGNELTGFVSTCIRKNSTQGI